ncbi:MAG: flagellar hook-length control protein FliK [Pseudomonadota bacterium]
MDAITQLIPAKQAPIGNAAGAGTQATAEARSSQAGASESFARSLANEQAQANDKPKAGDAEKSPQQPSTPTESDPGTRKDSGNSAAIAMKPKAQETAQETAQQVSTEDEVSPVQGELRVNQAPQEEPAINITAADDAEIKSTNSRPVAETKAVDVASIDAENDALENADVARAMAETAPVAQPDTPDTQESDSPPLLQALMALSSAQPAAKPMKPADQQTPGAGDESTDITPVTANDTAALIAPNAAAAKPAQNPAPAAVPRQPTALGLADQKPLAQTSEQAINSADLDGQPKVSDAEPETQTSKSPKTVVVDTPAQTYQAERPSMSAPITATAPIAPSADTLQMKPIPEVTVQIPQQRADVAAKHVGLEISRQAAKSETHFAIRMDPPELGKLDVKLTLTKSAEVQASIVVEREATFDLLSRDMKALEKALQDAGLKTDQNSLQLSLKNQGFGQGEEGSHGSDGLGRGPSDGGEDGLDDMDDVIAAQALQHPASDRPVDIII